MAPAIRQLPARLELVAAASRDAAKAQALASEFGCQAVTGYAGLLVVGSIRLGPIAEFGTGSAIRRISSSAACPVVSVPG